LQTVEEVTGFYKQFYIEEGLNGLLPADICHEGKSVLV
jgi:hypothetical protein